MPFRPTPYQIAAATVSLIAAGLVAAALLATSARAQERAGPDAWKAMRGPQETAVRGCIMRSGEYRAFWVPRGEDLLPVGDVETPAEAPPSPASSTASAGPTRSS